MDPKLSRILATVAALAVLVPVTIYAVEFFDGRSNVTAGTIDIAADKLVFSNVGEAAGSRLANITPAVLFTDLNGVSAASALGADNVLVRADGTGKGVQSTGISVDDSDNMTGIASMVTDALNAGSLEFEGATADANETTLGVTDPTADRTITLPDATGTVALTTGTLSTQSGVHATPTTTNPLAPTWSGPTYMIWYGATGEIDLPAAAGYAMRGIIIYNTGAFTVTIDPNASEVIVRDGTAQTGGVTFTLSSGAGNYVALISDGARWITLGYKGTLSVGS